LNPQFKTSGFAKPNQGANPNPFGKTITRTTAKNKPQERDGMCAIGVSDWLLARPVHPDLDRVPPRMAFGRHPEPKFREVTFQPHQVHSQSDHNSSIKGR